MELTYNYFEDGENVPAIISLNLLNNKVSLENIEMEVKSIP